MATAAGYAPFIPDQGYIHLDQGQLAYQELMHGFQMTQHAVNIRNFIVSPISPIGILDKSLHPFSLSEYTSSLISIAAENLQMIGRDVQRTALANFSNSHYTLLRSAIEQLGLALLLMDGGDERYKCQLLLRAAEDNHQNEVKFLKALIRSSDAKLRPRSNPSAYKFTFENRVRSSNTYALETLENDHQDKKDEIRRRHPGEIFEWEVLPDTVGILEKATDVFARRSGTQLLGGDLSTVWRVCSGNAHGKMWSEKQLSRSRQDNNVFVTSYSEPEPRVLSTIYTAVANMCNVAAQLYMSKGCPPYYGGRMG